MLLEKENIDINAQDKVCNIFICQYWRYVVYDQLLHIHSMVRHHYILQHFVVVLSIVSMLLKKENIDVNIQNRVFVC